MSLDVARLPADEHDDQASEKKSLERQDASIDLEDSDRNNAEEIISPAFDSWIVGWDGGDSDPLCPRSFGKVRKWIMVIVVCMTCFCVTASSSIYTATYDHMESDFGNGRLVSVLGLSMFVVGMAIGPLLFSPLSEFYGRRPIYLSTWAFYVIWLVPQAVAHNIETMIIARFLNGFAGGTFLSVSGGTVGDLFSIHELAFPMAVFSVSPFIGPCVGPLIGGFINYNLHWRWTYYVLLVWSGSLLVAMIFLVPETYHPVLLQKKAQQLRTTTGNERWKAPMELSARSIPRTIAVSLLRPFQLLFFELMCLSLCIYSAILLGILYLFFGAFPLIFRTNYGFNAWQIGLSFLGIGIGLIIGVSFNPLWRRVRDHLIASRDGTSSSKTGDSEPEYRLPPAIVGAVVAPLGLFMFAWTSYPSVHWVVPILGSLLFGTGNILIFIGIFTFLVDAYPHYAASALAANTFTRCLFAGIFPLFGNQMYEKLGFQWASSLVAFLTVAMLPFPYLFFKYGKALRARSRAFPMSLSLSVLLGNTDSLWGGQPDE